MLRRCMTPNPHSQTKYLSDLVQDPTFNRKQSPKINYDSFFYVDRLTNNKIMLGQAKNMYSQKQKRNSSQTNTIQSKQTKRNNNNQSNVQRVKQYSQSKQMEEINDCFSIMKSTKFFQMENLKNKLFTKIQGNQNKQNNQIQCMIKKKKKIREFIQEYLNNLCLNEFRKYMEPTMDKQKIKLINPNILNIHKAMSNKINKHNVQKIIDQFLQSQNNNQQKRPCININMDDIYFPDEERLKELLFHRMFLKKKQFQFLVTPGPCKQIYNQMHASVREKTKNQEQSEVFDKLEAYKFNQFAEGTVPKIQKPKSTKWKNTDKKLELKKKQLMIAIESGSIYDLLFLIIRWPLLLKYKDKLGNNLLHIAAKQNQFQIYNILIKKLGVQALKQKNNCGKTPIQISQLYGSLQTQQINQQYVHCL